MYHRDNNNNVSGKSTKSPGLVTWLDTRVGTERALFSLSLSEEEGFRWTPGPPSVRDTSSYNRLLQEILSILFISRTKLVRKNNCTKINLDLELYRT